MVHKWLIKKGWGMILFGLILFFVVGPIVYIFLQPVLPTSHHPPLLRKEQQLIYSVMFLMEYYRLSWGAGIGAIGIFFIIFGTMYFLATTILEYNKKRRLAHRSKM